MKYHILIALILLCVPLQAQQLKFSTGTNFTEFAYENSANQTDSNLRNGRGNFYELSLVSALDSAQVLNYEVGFVLNEYNAVGGNLLNLYTWQTSYVGLKTGFSVALLTTKSGFRWALNTAITGSSLLKGTQAINGQANDLKGQEDFSGFFLETAAGVHFSYPITDITHVGVGYQYGKSTRLDNESQESLGFKNHQIQFNLQFKLRNNEKESADIIATAK